jgi:RNA polymerase sigma-70 factor, ECF subfamily
MPEVTQWRQRLFPLPAPGNKIAPARVLFLDCVNSEGETLRSGISYFDESLWPHLHAAYNFARWLLRNDHDAEDVVQESFLKAFLASDDFRGGDPRLWLLAIVRNTALNFMRGRRADRTVPLEDRMPDPPDRAADPEKRLLGESRRERVQAAIGDLPEDFREALVLREFEELSYKEIAAIVGAPIGTVMSRLSRARALLVEKLIAEKGAGL